MKAFISLLAAILVLFVAAPQESKAQTVKFGETDHYRTCSKLTAADSINGTAELGKVFEINKDFEYHYQIGANAHNVAHVGNVYFYLYGSQTGESTDWKLLETVTWKVTSADTCVYFNSGTTKVVWNYLKPAIKGASAGNRTTLTKANCKIAR